MEDNLNTDMWLRRLSLAADQPVPVPVCGPDLLAAATTAAGPAAVAWACQVGARSAADIVEVMPHFGPNESWRAMLRMGTESATLSALVLLSSHAGDAPPVTDEAKKSITFYVENGITVDQLLRGIRLGHAAMSSAFLSACDEFAAGENRAAVVRAVSTRLFEHIDRFAQEAADWFNIEHDRWATSASTHRRNAVERLISGSPLEPQDIDVLSYPLDGHHRAVSISYDRREPIVTTTAGPVLRPLQQIAYDVLRTLGARHQLVVEISDSRVWAWAGYITGSSEVPHVRPYPGTLVSIGAEGRGVEGIRHSHRQAAEVERLQNASSSIPSTELFDNVELIALATQDMSATQHFVRRVLGPLADDDEHTADLRETVRVYLDVHASPSAAARRLHLARNTVSSRVHRASLLLGRSLEADCADLHLALTLTSTLGAAALGTI